MRILGLVKPKTFERALGLILVLNIVDAALTAAWVSTGIATEGNPVMAAALEHGFGPFVLGKVALVGLGVGLLYRYREERFARLALIPAALLYSFVIGNHFGIGVMVSGLV
ncbi:MAG: hypothetical protein CL927_15400 [Deltaproteobacteria bacterium]|nr:hypothetical protein [Deltaproteobacteria bacterium]HCH61457.1 hypothetical protein [Deltaproteobacteria bacterium]